VADCWAGGFGILELIAIWSRHKEIAVCVCVWGGGKSSAQISKQTWDNAHLRHYKK